MNTDIAGSTAVNKPDPDCNGTSQGRVEPPSNNSPHNASGSQSKTAGKAEQVKKMFASIASRYDLSNTVLSFGIHHYWRYYLLSLVARNPELKVLDVCTGTGDLLRPLKQRYGKVTGLDFCQPMLDLAAIKLTKTGDSDIELIQGDALALPFADNTFDLITVSFGVRNFENLDSGLSEIARVLKPQGTLLILEFGQPDGTIFGPVYNLYAKYLLPVIGGWLSGNKDAYTYLPETASKFPCGLRFVEHLRKAGLKVSKARPLSFGIAFAYKANKI